MSDLPEVGLYTPINADLPALYRRDPRSWAQVVAYLDLIDDAWRGYLNQLIELPALISPLALSVTPPGQVSATAIDARDQGRDVGLNEAARWLGVEFPTEPYWQLEAVLSDETVGENAARQQRNQQRLTRKSAVLARIPALWRRRSTPAGFLAWLCCWFDLARNDAALCPVLLEHHAFTNADPARAAFNVSLLIPQNERFTTYDDVVTLADWIDANAPAHLIVHYYLIPAAAWSELCQKVLPTATDLETLLTLVRGLVPTVGGMHTHPSDVDENDGLDVGRLANFKSASTDFNQAE